MSATALITKTEVLVTSLGLVHLYSKYLDNKPIRATAAPPVSIKSSKGIV
jgi:hypothetical protein